MSSSLRLSYGIYFAHADVSREQKAIAEKEKHEKEMEWHINQMNMRFSPMYRTSSAHRSPWYQAPSAHSRQRQTDGRRAETAFGIVQRSVQRMLKLVNQLLDFQKLENDGEGGGIV